MNILTKKIIDHLVFCTDLLCNATVKFTNTTYQENGVISVEDNNNGLMLIHEICHLLAARNSFLNKPNLGLPGFKSIDPNEDVHFIYESKTLYFTHILFSDWIKSIPDGVEKSYLEYLSEYDNRKPFPDIINTDVWCNRLNIKLNNNGIDIQSFKKICQEKWDMSECHIKVMA